MKKTIEILKNAGIIDRVQRAINRTKLPEGLEDTTINYAIKKLVVLEMGRCPILSNQVIDAFFEDMAKAVRNELNIKYSKPDDDEIISMIVITKKNIDDNSEKEGE